ncbi:MAG: MCE family protein [Deltaproteobacteria bacterium]|nr:MCE family protein [Deltaproteobacteria bacterium]
MNKEQRAGLFFIGGLLVFFVAIALTGQSRMFTNSWHLYAQFSDVHGLTAGAPVRVAGVEAGSVSSVRLVEGGVRVGIELDGDVAVYGGSEAVLDYQALSGNRFVAISAGDPVAGRLGDGDSIEGIERGGLTGALGELERVGSSIRELVESFNSNQADLLGTLNKIVDENAAAISATAGSLEIITSRIAAGEGTLGRLSADDSLYTEMTGALASLKVVADNISTLTGRLVDGEGSLGELLTDDSAFYDEARETMARLRSSTDELDRMASMLNSGDGTIGKLLTDDSLYYETEDAIRALGRTAETIEDQAPISVIGTAIGTLF